MTGAELREWREAHDLTQRDLASLLGPRVTQSTIWRWESGRTAIAHPTILALAISELTRILEGES